MASTQMAAVSSGLAGLRARRSASAGPRRSALVCSAAHGVRFTGVGSALPKTRITNDDLAKMVDTNDEWIRQRTGIGNRHVLGDGELLADYATIAAAGALEMAQVAPEDIDMVLMASSSPDDIFGTAPQVAAKLGCKNAVAFDLTAACSGFVLGVVTGSQYIRTGFAKNILIIGADALSRYTDWTDRRTCILFGDGCGAMVMQQQLEGAEDSFLSADMHTDGTGHKTLSCMYDLPVCKPFSEYAASEDGKFMNIDMNGQEVFKFAVRAVPKTLKSSLKAAGKKSEDIDWLVLHQANQRIIDSAAQRFGLPDEKVASNIAKVGNTSAASIPIALDEIVRAGSVKSGDMIAIAGFGAGLTWGSALFNWDGPTKAEE